MLQFTQVHKVTGAVLVTRTAFWGQNPAPCSKFAALPHSYKRKATADEMQEEKQHLTMGSCRASEMAPLLYSCTQKQPGRHVGGGAPPRKGHFPTAPGGTEGGDSGQEEDSQRHWQKAWITTTAPRAQPNPEQPCPTSLSRQRG